MDATDAAAPALQAGLPAPVLLPPPLQLLLFENQALKQQVLNLTEQNTQLTQQVEKLKAEKDAAVATAAAAALQHQQVELDRAGEDSGDDEDYQPSPKKAKRGGTGGSHKLSAAEKEEAKATRQRGTLFLKSAGSHLSDGMNWHLRGKAVSFKLSVDEAAFDHVFGGTGEQYEVKGSGANKNKKLRVIKLDQEGALSVFGKTRCTKKYRSGSNGFVTSMEVTYDPALRQASCVANWEVDNVLDWKGSSFFRGRF